MGMLSAATDQLQIFGVKSSIPWRRYRDVVVVNAVRSLKVRCRGSILGTYWSLSNPLLMTGVYTIIFGAAFANCYGDEIANYARAIFTGLAFLVFFSGSTSMALPMVVNNGVLLNKISLPPSLFPVATGAPATFQLCFGVLPLLMIIALVISHSVPVFLIRDSQQHWIRDPSRRLTNRMSWPQDVAFVEAGVQGAVPECEPVA